MKIIGIAGGTGSGKSTITYRLVDTYPDIFEVLNFDDYQRLREDKKKLPVLHGMINWDTPHVIDWGKLFSDIKTLQNVIPVTIQTWAHRSNPEYFKHKKMISRTIYPKEVLIIEGYLALWHNDLRKLYSRTYYLLADKETMLQRRDKFADNVKKEYETKVLIPMHKKYVEPTKEFADIVLDASKLNADQIFEKVEQDLKKSDILN
jgi:uridine kinase